jgi:hypothetical protein
LTEGKKYDRIVFLTETPFTKRDEERYGLNAYITKGFNVEVFDVGKLYHKETYSVSRDSLSTERFIFQIETRKQLENLLMVNNVRTVVMMLMPLYINLVYLLNKLEVDYLYYLQNQIPFHSGINSLNPFQKIKRFVMTNALKRILLKPFSFVSNRLRNLIFKYISNPKYIVIGGNASYLLISEKLKSKAKIIWAHALDYDLYLKSKNGELKRGYEDIFGNIYAPGFFDDCIVFLDEFSPYHPDHEFLGIPYPDNAEVYYPAVERFFAFLEIKFGKRVVIAAHPKSDYISKKHFQSYCVVKGQTVGLIKNCSFALLHSSTSVNFLNLFSKSVIFFHTLTMTNEYKIFSKVFAGWHQTSSIEIGLETNLDLIDFNALLNKNINYEVYKNAFIKSEKSKEGFSWDIISQEFYL